MVTVTFSLRIPWTKPSLKPLKDMPLRNEAFFAFANTMADKPEGEGKADGGVVQGKSGMAAR